VTLYHFVVEASLAQTGQHMILSYLEERDMLPAFRAGMRNIATDEQRHIAFGVKLLADLSAADEHVPHAVAQLLREVLPYTSQVLMPPDWDERYLSCFGYTFDRIGVEGVISLRTKLSSAGLPIERLPGAPVVPANLTPLEVTRRGRMLAQAGITGVREGPSRRDPQTVALLFDMLARSLAPRGLAGAFIVQWEFSDPDIQTWHIALAADAAFARPGAAPSPDVRLRLRYQDFVDIVGGRLELRRALLRGRLRARGSPRALVRMIRALRR
jgi:hypothetical protein